MVPCQTCGENIQDSGRFCPYCGAEQAVVRDTMEGPSSPPPAMGVDDVDLAATMMISPGGSSLGDGDLDVASLVNAAAGTGPSSSSDTAEQSFDGFTAGGGSITGLHGRYDVGDVVDRYRIEAILGQGGMGQVFRAVHEITGQEVALKMLHQEKLDTASDRDRFFNEARVLAQLDHPNLVPLLGFIEEENGIFIVLPFIDGETLEDLLAREGRPPLEKALDLFDQLCAGLAWVHEEKAILHRDLKPANVLITEDGIVKLTDFGIARHVGDKAMTAAGMVVGTAEYLAPERAAGTLRDDPRSDLYGLAVMLYEMLTGRPPFQDANAAKVMLKHLNNDPPPPRGINPSLSPAIEAEVLKALAKDPEERHRDIASFRAAVSNAARAPVLEDEKPTIPFSSTRPAGDQTGGPEPPQPVSSSAVPSGGVEGNNSNTGWWIIALVLTLLLGGGGFAAYWYLIHGTQ